MTLVEANGSAALVNRHGLHARPAQMLVEIANRRDCEVEVEVEAEGRKANAKSILSLLTLSAAKGATLRFRCEGDGAEEALAELLAAVDGGLGDQD